VPYRACRFRNALRVGAGGERAPWAGASPSLVCIHRPSALIVVLCAAQGDVDNEELFQSGYDGARQKSYQYVQEPEVVSALLFKEISHVSCGEDHSAAVSSASAVDPLILLTCC
jgi:hypothetical protein